MTQTGNPVAGAVVRITGDGFYGRRDVSTQTDVDGTIDPIEGLGIGSYSVTASSEQLGGSREFEITQADHGSTIDLTVGIEASSSAAGEVIDPEGQPAEGALVKMILGGRTFQTVSDADGLFEFSALPANQTYRLEAFAANGLGRHTLNTVSVGTDFVDLGVLVLDETNPWVAGVTPANGAQDADTDVDLVIDFSELMRWGTLTGDRIKLREQGSGHLVSTSRTIENQPDADGDGPLVAFTRVTLTHSPLASENLYLIDVLKTVEDSAGRSPAFDFHSTFRTRDTVPPQVLNVSPADDPGGVTPVAPDAVPIISFSESMDPESVDASTVRLLDSDGQPLETVLDLQREGFDVRIRPTTALALDAFYTIVIDGVTDAAGLPLPAPRTSTFRVRDIDPPVVTLLPPEGVTIDGDNWTALEGRGVTLLATVASNDALRLVVFTVNGIPIDGSPGETAGTYEAAVTLPIGLASVMITVTAEDVSGNLSAEKAHPIVLVDDEPPTGTLSAMPTGEVLPNHVLTISANVRDDHGLRTAFLSITGVVEQHWTMDVSGNVDLVTQEVRIPVEAFAGSQIVVSCDVQDTLDQRVPLSPMTITIREDSQPPAIVALEPEPGTTFRAGQEVNFRFSLEDEVVAHSPQLEIDGETVPVSIQAGVLPGDTWRAEATAVWIVPEIEGPVELPWTMIAVDQAGNTGSTNGILVAAPAQGPEDPVVSFVCPMSGDHCIPDIQTNVIFTIEDDDQIQHYSVYVDGDPRVENQPVDDISFNGDFGWTPPADAQPGEHFAIRVVARDYNGNEGLASVTLSVPIGTVLTGDQELPADYEGEILYLAHGTFNATSDLSPETLTLMGNATLTSPDVTPLRIEGVNEITIECSSAISVTGRGYGPGSTHPEAEPPSDGSRGGGSHLGQGGTAGGQPGETYGSVTHPQEFGAGGLYESGTRGGGFVSVQAGRLRIDGAIRANGVGTGDRGRACGAGGSVWIVADEVEGAGSIRANGGTAWEAGSSWVSESGAGGGGAVRIDSGDIAEEILGGLSASSGAGGILGGAGTLVVIGPESVHGDLVVDGKGIDGGWTVLPVLGAGIADGGSAGPTLVTDRAEEIPGYFIDHWVRVFSPDGTVERGTWRVVQVDGLVVTLESGAEVAPGDLWQGLYRFDSVVVRGNARLRVGDLDDFGSVDVEEGSVLEMINHEPPAIDLEKIELTAYGGVFRVLGDIGAVTDPDGIASARIVNETGGQSTPVGIREGGWFGGTIGGVAGDSIFLEAVDRHPNPLTSNAGLGALPANIDIPAIDPDRIQFVAKTNPLGYVDRYLDGDTGAVVDLDRPVLITATNLATGFSRQTTAAEDGNFSMTVRGTAGDPYELTVTDGHPVANTAVLDLGPLPDLLTPYIYPGQITVSVRDRLYWLSSQELAFWDDGEIAEAYAFNISLPAVTYPLEILPDGVLAPSPIPSHTGVILQIVVVDGVGHQRVALLDPLPANDGPPIIRTEHISTTLAEGTYSVETTASCFSDKQTALKSVNCSTAIESQDGLNNARFENRTTPVFGPFDFTAIEDCTHCYRFDPVAVDGVVGDEIWLVVEDGHPDWQGAEALVWTLPPIPGAPQILLDPYQLRWVDNQYLLEIFENDITDRDEPLTLEVVVWRETEGDWIQVQTSTRGMASGEPLSVPLPGGEEGDLVVVSATDANGLKTTVRLGFLPYREPILLAFEDGTRWVGEDDDTVELDVEISKMPLNPVVVSYRTVMGSAQEGTDYEYKEGTVTFPRGVRNDQGIVIAIANDDVAEGDEFFRVELFDPVGATLGSPSSSEITIEDDDEVTIVAYSVAVGAPDFLDGPIEVSIVGGVAQFAQPLPAVVGRGDRIEIEGLGPVFIDHCTDDSMCKVVDRRGQPPIDAYGVLALEATAAFGSMAEALDGAADADHLDTYDLVSAGRALELVCYGGVEDTAQVVIDSWVTSTVNAIRIVAADASYGHDGSWRHPGRWSDQAYRLNVVGAEACIDSHVGHLKLEGLQLNCENPFGNVNGIQLDGIEGDVEIAETLVHLGPSSSPDDRIAIHARNAFAPVEVVVRNSILWDLGDGGSPDHVGILVDDPMITLLAANNTVFGGRYGIRVGSGTVTATNNLVAASTEASYDGTFTPESAGNLASDDTAPGPPANASGQVTVEYPTASLDADFHLGCGVLEHDVTVTPNFDGGDMNLVFDGDPGSLVTSGGVNPATVTLEFAEDRTVTGTSVVLSHWSSHDWMVEAAYSVAGLEPGSPDYRVLVERRNVENEHLAWDGVTFATPETFGAIRLTVWRNGGDDYVHINEWALDSLNSACGQGMDLSAAGAHPFFVRDVDSVGRTGAWDIGADQSRELEVGIVDGPMQWWEEELHASIQVMLSEPATQEVRVRYRTAAGSAEPPGDYDPAPGELVFGPGEISKIISVPLVNDGFTSEGVDDFTVVLFDAAGARLGNEQTAVEILEGTPPPRVRLLWEMHQVNEAVGVASFRVRLSNPLDIDVFGNVDAIDDTAHIVADYRGMYYVNGGPWAQYSIAPGDEYGLFEFEVTDDDVSEGVEGFRIKIGGVNGAQLGVPSEGYVLIADDDWGSP